MQFDGHTSVHSTAKSSCQGGTLTHTIRMLATFDISSSLYFFDSNEDVILLFNFANFLN